jgi:putative copper resistance protein D
VAVLALLTTLVVVEAASVGGADAVWSAAGLAAMARTAVVVAACGTVGSLALAGLVLRGGAAQASADVSALLASAARWAVLWVVASACSALLLLSPAGQGAAVAAASVHGWVDEVAALRDGLRAAVVTGWVAGLVALLARAATRPRQVVGVLVLAFAALVPAVLVAHSGHADARALAIGSMVLHLVAVTTWVGGVLVLVSHPGRGSVPVAEAFSSLALVCFVLVGISGVANVTTQVSLGDLIGTGAYGWLIMAKVASLLVLGLCGAVHRSRTLRRMRAGSSSAFWLLLAGEAVLMAAVIGAAAVLGQTAR